MPREAAVRSIRADAEFEQGKSGGVAARPREARDETGADQIGEEAAKMPFSVHPHMLRHACGYKLANQG
jgi:hypothetical protein